MRRRTLAALVIAVSAASRLPAQEPSPRVYLLRAENLAATRIRLRAGDSSLAPAYARLLADARQALVAAPMSVTQKKRIASSGDKHDYVSFGPYWWPDPTRPDGVPFIRRDGQVNPASRDDSDSPRFARTSDAASTLALAYYFTGDERFARHAALLLRTWFLDSAMRMNPNLRFGQAIPGITEGRGIGLIDTRELASIADAVGLIQGSANWTADDQRGMAAWYRAFLEWLKTSEEGQEEAVQKNNHGTWVDAQTAAIALFVGDTALARQVIAERARHRVDVQIRADGRQPAELARTRSLSYSEFNLDAFTRLAELARWVGVDLWHYASPNGGSIRGALAYLAPYADSTKAWPGQQITPVSSKALLTPYRRADAALRDATLRAALLRIPAPIRTTDRSRLLYPNAP
jgi:hypothetical protein